jgi:hypothetical protein
MRGALALMLASGCSSLFGIGNPTPAIDAALPSCPVGAYDPCAHQMAYGPLTFSADTTIDTALDCSFVLYDPDVGSACVMFATDVSIAATVKGAGARPLVIAATGTITIAGTVDVSSHLSPQITGAGANDASCVPKHAATSDSNGSGGGAGGTFGGKGGDGGSGAGGAPGIAADVTATPGFPRGGCIGDGTDRNGTTGGGAGVGLSGGGVWLVAGAAIDVATTGRVLANGSGGGGGGGFQGLGGGGGGGGGSGGFVRLAAPTITVAGGVFANGGGGGGGTDSATTTATAGADGGTSSQPATGGTGAATGGSGGAGTTLAGTNGGSSKNTGGGGAAGGGGAGIIQLAAPSLVTTGATISPPSS